MLRSLPILSCICAPTMPAPSECAVPTATWEGLRIQDALQSQLLQGKGRSCLDVRNDYGDMVCMARGSNGQTVKDFSTFYESLKAILEPDLIRKKLRRCTDENGYVIPPCDLSGNRWSSFGTAQPVLGRRWSDAKYQSHTKPNAKETSMRSRIFHSIIIDKHVNIPQNSASVPSRGRTKRFSPEQRATRSIHNPTPKSSSAARPKHGKSVAFYV